MADNDYFATIDVRHKSTGRRAVLVVDIDIENGELKPILVSDLFQNAIQQAKDMGFLSEDMQPE